MALGIRGVRWRWSRWAPQATTRPGERKPPRETSGATPGSHATAAPPSDFEPFFREHERAVYSLLWRLTGDAQAASDLTQETFLRAWRRFEQVRAYDNPRAWLLRVATNLAFTAHRYEAARQTLSTDRLTDADSPSRSDPTRGLAESDLVQRTLLELPPNQRAALSLREVYGFSCEEIGEMLGLTRDAVKMALFRAREGFRRRYLGKDGAR